MSKPKKKKKISVFPVLKTRGCAKTICGVTDFAGRIQCMNGRISA